MSEIVKALRGIGVVGTKIRIDQLEGLLVEPHPLATLDEIESKWPWLKELLHYDSMAFGKDRWTMIKLPRKYWLKHSPKVGELRLESLPPLHGYELIHGIAHLWHDDADWRTIDRYKVWTCDKCKQIVSERYTVAIIDKDKFLVRIRDPEAERLADLIKRKIYGMG